MEHQDFPSNFSLSLSPKDFCRGILYCCSNAGYRKCSDKKGEYQDFSSKIFCLRVPKNSVEESSTVALNSCSGKVWIRRGGRLRISVEKFLSHSAERLRRVTLFCYINFGYLKGLHKRGRGDSNTPSKFFSHSAENFRRRNLYCCTKFGYRKSLEKRGGEVPTFSVENFLSHIAERFRRRILYCCISFR